MSIALFKCEGCGLIFESEEAANQCEAAHPPLVQHPKIQKMKQSAKTMKDLALVLGKVFNDNGIQHKSIEFINIKVIPDILAVAPDVHVHIVIKASDKGGLVEEGKRLEKLLAEFFGTQFSLFFKCNASEGFVQYAGTFSLGAFKGINQGLKQYNLLSTQLTTATLVSQAVTHLLDSNLEFQENLEKLKVARAQLEEQQLKVDALVKVQEAIGSKTEADYREQLQQKLVQYESFQHFN